MSKKPDGGGICVGGSGWPAGGMCSRVIRVSRDVMRLLRLNGFQPTRFRGERERALIRKGRYVHTIALSWEKQLSQRYVYARFKMLVLPADG